MKFALALLAGLLSAAPALAQNAVADASNQFGLDLFQHLRAQDGNLFLSPYSIDTAMLMVEAGAATQTASALQSALHLPSMPPDVLHAAAGDLISSLQADNAGKSYELHVANALWAQKNFSFLPSYTDILHTHYGADVNSADFADGPGTAKAINDWVAKQTNDRIKDLISPGGITPDMRLALVNAIYFKGNWKEPFDPHQTRDMPWNPQSSQTPARPTPMMHQRGDFRFYQDDHLAALQMDYVGDQLAMLALLPRDQKLGDLEASLTPDSLNNLIAGLNRDEVVVSFPKFTMHSRFDLSATLSGMGLKDAFSDAADFSGMDGRHDLSISDVVHAAFVQVDETGTEAAGATGITMRATAVRVSQIFNADHPFLFLIRDLKSGAILFIGRVDDPTK